MASCEGGGTARLPDSLRFSSFIIQPPAFLRGGRNPGPSFKVQGSRFRVQGSALDVRCWMLDVGCSAIRNPHSVGFGHWTSPALNPQPLTSVRLQTLNPTPPQTEATAAQPLQIQGALRQIG